MRSVTGATAGRGEPAHQEDQRLREIEQQHQAEHTDDGAARAATGKAPAQIRLRSAASSSGESTTPCGLRTNACPPSCAGCSRGRRVVLLDALQGS
jgi:hypothetical protein